MVEDELSSGRQAAAERSWLEAYEQLTAADETEPLAESDLEQLAFACYMIGREDEMVRHLERAHQLYLSADETLAAARAAIWIGLDLALRGELGPASGWLGRASRLVERHGLPSAEAGYLLMPQVLQQSNSGDLEGAIETASAAVAIGEEHDEPDLVALALHAKGRALVSMGRVDDGLRLLDEAMVAVTADDLSPMVTGIIYCSVIEGCYEVQELRRAHSWTEALTAWCGGQPDLVAFTGQCLTHRSELMQLRGDWDEALREAQRAGERFLEGTNQLPAARAHYRQGELHRLRGEYEAAEEAYRRASQWGWPPQPGLAMLRFSQGNSVAAEAALTTSLSGALEPIERARFLPALVQVLLRRKEFDAASTACDELDEIAAVYRMTMIGAAAHVSRGSLLLAQEQYEGALEALRRARSTWLALDAPYELARVRALTGKVYEALGDAESARLEREAAVELFDRLGAVPDRDLAGAHDATGGGVLTPREVEVLRLVATGMTNKAIAEELFVSNRTIDRHVSNILTKLGVASRTAAAAYALETKLI
jgi:DNA-binding CsgD family transcriptional regulator